MKRVFGLLALLSALATLWLWWESGRLVPRATVLRQINRCDTFFFTGDARLFVCGDAKEIRVYDVLRGELLAIWPRSIHRLERVSQPYGEVALGVFHTGEQVEVFDLISGRTVGRFSPGREFSYFVYLSPNGKFAATVHDKEKLRVWELETGRLLREFYFGPSVWSVSFSADSARLAVAGRGNSVKVMTVSTGEVTSYAVPTVIGVYWCSFTGDGRLLGVTGLNPEGIGLWDLTNNRLIARWPLADSAPVAGGLFCEVNHHPFRSFAKLAYKIGAECIARECSDLSLRLQIFDTRTGRLVASFPAAKLATYAVFPDGKTLATFSYKDGCLRLWDLPPKRAVHPGFAWGAFGLTVVLAAWWRYLPRSRSDHSRRPGTATSPGLLTSDGKTTA